MMFINFIGKIIVTALETLNSISFWIVLAFIFIFLTRLLIKTERINKYLGSYEPHSIILSIVLGCLIPTYGSGSLVLGLALFHSGASVGASLSFITSSMLLNPLAITLSLNLLGKDIVRLNITIALFLSVIIGIIANFFIKSKNLEKDKKNEFEFLKRMKKEFFWLNSEFAPKASFHFIIGIFINSLLTLTLPSGVFYEYFIDPKTLTISVTALLSFFRFIDPVGHIIYAVSLISSGAEPGIALTLLLVGFATNIPTILCLATMINNKSAVLFTGLVSVFGVLSGIIANHYLGDNFYLYFNFEESAYKIEEITMLRSNFPTAIQSISSLILLLYFLIYIFKFFYMRKQNQVDRDRW